MKKLSLLLFAILFAFVLNAQTANWDYTVDITGNAVASWHDMSDSSHLTNSSSNSTWYFNLPRDWDFSFYGNHTSHFYFSSEGLIRFNAYINGSYHGPNNLPTTENYYYYNILSFGGNTNGKIGTTFYKYSGTSPFRVLTIQTKYYTSEISADPEYADVQITLYETKNTIEVLYTNCGGSDTPADILGLNANDGVYGNNVGSFPTANAKYVFTPVYPDDDMKINNLVAEAPGCSLSNQSPLSIDIFNFGNNTQTGFKPFYIINGDTTKETFTGNLNQWEDTTYNFSGVDLSANDYYNITAGIIWGATYSQTYTSTATINYLDAEVDTPTIACYGNPASLTASGGDYYNWENSSGTALFSDSLPFITDPLFIQKSYKVNAQSNDLFVKGWDKNETFVDHNSYSGDDRGGVAITPDYFYVVGDNNTVRMKTDLTNMVSFPIRDGIFSDLANGNLYTLWDTTSNKSVSRDGIFPFPVNAIVPMDTNLNIDTANAIILDTTFFVDVDNACGVFVGKGVVFIYDGASYNLLQINIADGSTDSIGNYPNLNNKNTENWAQWGFVEYRNKQILSIIYSSDGKQLERMLIPSGSFSTVGKFTRTNDLHSITISPWNNRLYWHTETSDEDACYSSVYLGFGGDCWTDFTVSITPLADAGNTTSTDACNSNDSINLFPLISGTPQANGVWTDNDATGALTNGILDATGLTEGTYHFTYVVYPTDPCTENDSSTITLDIAEAPNAGVATPATVCQNISPIYNLNESLDGSQDITGYWTDDDATGILSGSMIDVSTLSFGNDYNFTYHAMGSGACDDDTSTVVITVDVCDGLFELSNNISVYPNPSNGVFSLSVNNFNPNSTVEITNLAGKTIYSNNLTSNNSSIDITGIETGVYFIKVKSNTGTDIQKLIIQ